MKKKVATTLAASLVAGFFLLSLGGCGDPPHRGVATPEALEQALKEAYESGDTKRTFSYFYIEGSPKEVQDVMKNLIGGFGSGKLKIQKVEFIPFSDYFSITTEMPGRIDGKKLKWLLQPTHWVVLSAADLSKNPDGLSDATLHYPVAQIQGAWWIVSATFADKN